MDIFEILIWAIPVLIVVGILAYYGRKILSWSNNNHSEIKIYEVTVIEKKEKYALLGASAAKGLSNEASPRRYYLKCETNDGEILSCQVPYNVFDIAKEDRSYLLTMQGTRFIKIEKQQENETNE